MQIPHRFLCVWAQNAPSLGNKKRGNLCFLSQKLRANGRGKENIPAYPIPKPKYRCHCLGIDVAKPQCCPQPLLCHPVPCMVQPGHGHAAAERLRIN